MRFFCARNPYWQPCAASIAVLLCWPVVQAQLANHTAPQSPVTITPEPSLETFVPTETSGAVEFDINDGWDSSADSEPPIADETEPDDKRGRGSEEDEPEREEFCECEESELAEFADQARLETRLGEGVTFASENEDFELRIRLMEQTDFKYFLPEDQEPARPGVYIPRFRTYFEGHITLSFEYELSLQRSVDGEFDVLDANINYRPNEAFQVKLGRFLVPYSYDWYDHLEQYFITPERALFPLNFGLSREAGLMVWGKTNQQRFEYALGAFSGQLAGVADNNTTRDLVAYVNARPTPHLNLGGSVAVGDQAFPAEPLPMRTSVQASENDEAARAASSVFLAFEDGVFYQGTRRQGALHLAWYGGSLSVETEFQAGEFRFRTPDGAPLMSVYGYHIGAGYFVTGERVMNRSIVVPRCPFNPARGRWGTGAIETFCRFSHLALDDEVFTEGLANPDDWTRRASIVDLGFNWHPNRFIKCTFDWQVSLYDTPVMLNQESDERIRQNHLLWMRAQVFF